MSAKIIYADFKTRTFHAPSTLEEMAIAMTEQLNRMAEEGTEVICVPYGGAGIDGMTLGQCGPCESVTLQVSDLPAWPYQAPENDAS